MSVRKTSVRKRSRVRTIVLVVVVVPVALALAGCAAGPNTAAGGPDPAGFWLGLWQGIICPITFVISLFDDDVSMYEVNNNGGWYDFGFLLGLAIPASIFGAAGRRGAPKRSGRVTQ